MKREIGERLKEWQQIIRKAASNGKNQKPLE